MERKERNLRVKGREEEEEEERGNALVKGGLAHMHRLTHFSQLEDWMGTMRSR